MEHTKGPWKYDGDGFVGTDKTDSQTLCFLSEHRNQRRRDEIETQANGHLIAAAPDLLAVCESVRDLIYSHSHGYYTVDYTDLATLLPKIRVAIAAARGK